MNWIIFNPRAIGRALARSFTTSDFVRRWTETLSDIAGILRHEMGLVPSEVPSVGAESTQLQCGSECLQLPLSL